MSSRLRTLVLYASGFPTWKRLVADSVTGTLGIPVDRIPPRLQRFKLVRYLGESYRTLSYLIDWRDAFVKDPELDVTLCNVNDLPGAWRRLRHIHEYDLIVVLHSATGDDMSFLHRTKDAFKRRRGKLLMFIGNEYDLMPEKIGFARSVEVEYIASQLPLVSARWLYGDATSAQVLPAPFALNPEVYRSQEKPRPIDVGFRGDLHPFFIGDQERTQFIRGFAAMAPSMGLTTDIVVNKRFPRDRWSDFLNQCKGIVGAESGTNYLEKTDKTKSAVLRFLKEQPTATFEMVYERFFRDYRNAVSGKAISGRHFEAIGTKTCQILLEGEYNGLLRADEHYIAVRKDLSNLGDAVRRFSDAAYRQSLVDRTYEYTVECHTYAHRVRDLIQTISGRQSAV